MPGILANRFELGDFTDAQNLLLTGRISEAANFNEVGANWYWDGPWRTPVAWAAYLAGHQRHRVRRTSTSTTTPPGRATWGPSLYTLMHTDYLAQLDASTGYLKRSFDNDSGGTWLFDDETALAGLAAYRYIATRIGDTAEAQWARRRLHQPAEGDERRAGRQRAGQTASTSCPCEVNVPVTADRCNTASDANWAGSDLWGQNVWDIFLEGGQLNGILGDPAQTDNLYETGFSRLAGSTACRTRRSAPTPVTASR